MSNVVVGQNWDRLKNLDIGELNELQSDVFEARFSDEQDIVSTLSHIFTEHYSYDVLSGPGPYAAVVLEVLSGPQIKNEATTGGRVNTTSINIDEYPYPFFKERKEGQKNLPVIIKARIPEIDVDIDWPKDDKDQVRIDAHGEFFQFKEDELLSKINPGSIVWVTFTNDKNFVSINGRPAGKIIGLHTVGVLSDIKTHLSPKKSFDPDCQAARNLGAPQGGLYVGHTDSDPNESIGPPIKKIKGYIKTGMYGNGSHQTKAHFEAALVESAVSSKHNIPGPAPGKNNAFIWIGNLKNNGYLDLLDRPLGQGRETIIYAPATLDLASPIEVKYYFHDKAGFGHAHINGPRATVEQAIAAAKSPGNDFREKIAPGILDLNKDGRNCVLVIPEMAYSRGFGTKNKDLARIDKIAKGEDAPNGSPTGPTIRTGMDSETRGAVRNYLKNIPAETKKGLDFLNPLRERELCTFDGSFTGGKFGDFHREVLDVLDEHLGTVYDKVEFVSFIAEGIGSLAFASIFADLSYSSVHTQGKVSFKNEFLGKKLRIDYITDQNLDSGGSYDYYFRGNPTLSLFANYLVERSEIGQGYTEFNYITAPSNKSQNAFFTFADKEQEFKNNIKKPTSGRGKKKFTFYTVGADSGPESFISMHVSPANNRVGYAFSMVNDFLSGKYPPKGNTRTDRPSFSAVPDHAYALATKPSTGDLERIKKKLKELEGSIKYFETQVLQEAFKDSESQLEPICAKFPNFCQENTLNANEGSLFFNSFSNYLDNKKNYKKLEFLSEWELQIQDFINDKDSLISLKANLNLPFSEGGLKVTKSEVAQRREKWDKLRGNFKITNTEEILTWGADAWYYSDQPGKGLWSDIAKYIAAQEAYEKVLNKIESAIKNASPSESPKPKDCLPQPKRRDEWKANNEFKAPAKSNKKNNNCSEINLSTPSTFSQLYNTMIPYYPKKSDFSFNGRVSKTPTKIHTIPGYEVDRFKYPARGPDGQITHKESPYLWACITSMIQKAWKETCEATGYYPFEITTGIRGMQDPKTSGTTAYRAGISLHSFGLAFDLDPFIAGYSKNGNPVNSVYTGAWTPGFIEKKGLDLWKLGVYKQVPSILKNNAYQEENRPRMAENWQGAPSHYRGGGESGGAREKYKKIMNRAKGTMIVPPGAKPTEWIIMFCEKTGMQWGNGLFLKKRWRGGRDWSAKEKQNIASMFEIPDIVDRVRAISWNTRIEDHMHIHYWGNKSLILWHEIAKVPEGGV